MFKPTLKNIKETAWTSHKKKKNYATISWFEQMSKFTEKN